MIRDLIAALLVIVALGGVVLVYAAFLGYLPDPADRDEIEW